MERYIEAAFCCRKLLLLIDSTLLQIEQPQVPEVLQKSLLFAVQFNDFIE